MQCDAFDSAALKKHSSTPCLDGKDIRVLLSPENQHQRSTVSGTASYLNRLVMHCN